MRLAVAAVLLLSGCGTDPVTAVDVKIDADACSAAAAERLSVRVLDGAGTEVEVIEVDVGGEAAISFPTGVRVVARDGDASRGWRVEATLLGAGDVPIGYQRARGGYQAEVAGAAELLFDDACLGIECPTGETCVEAQCTADDAAALRARHPDRETCPPLIFVDGTGGMDAEGCGTIDAPCATIQEAVDAHLMAGAGGVIHVRGESTYVNSITNDVVHLDLRHEGSATAPVVMRAWPGTGVPLIDARGMAGIGIVVNMAHTVFDRLAIRGAQRFGISLNGVEAVSSAVRRCEIYENGDGASPFDNHSNIELNNGAGRVLIEDCILRNAVAGTVGDPPMPGTQGSGIYVNDSPDGLTVRRCEVHDNEGHGVFVNNVLSFVIEDSRIVDNARDGIGGGADGPYRIERVRVCGNGSDGIAIGGAEDLVIRNVSVVDNDERGVFVSGEGPVTFEANLIALNEAVGFEVASTVEVVDAYNLYFENVGGAISGFVPDRPETDVMADPRVLGIEPCDLDLGDGSAARGAGPDGTNIGAR